MEAIELETAISKDGTMQLPRRYHRIYGKRARIVILLQDAPALAAKQMDPMKYSNTLDWPIDGMVYQQQARAEWR
ncbi:MAG: hypothetical protein ACP5J4_07295 [Anaerolineae bacterium]